MGVVMSKRGIVLVISIVLAVVMVMFVGAALGLGPGNLASSRQTAQRGQAEHAAESGVNYALCQLRADPNWRGDKNGVTINTPDLYVVEDNGNVIGVVRSPDGSWAQFRFRFNYQDGGTDAENLPDPGLTIDHPYVSCNNLLGGAPAEVPRADGPGFSVTPASEKPFSIPLWSVSLAVEGRAGSSVLNPANFNPPSLPGASRVTLEAVYQVPDMGPQVKEAAAMAARNFQAVLGRNGKVTVTSAAASKTPRIRSKGAVGVLNGDEDAVNYISADGKVATGSGFYAAYDSTATKTEAENANDDFYALTWDKVKKADPAQDTMQAGTYVWWDDGSLHYYDMSYEDYLTHIAANPGDAGDPTPSLPSSVSVSGSGAQKELELHKSVYIKPTGATPDFTIIPRAGAAESFPDDYLGGAGAGAAGGTTATSGAAAGMSSGGITRLPGGGEIAMATMVGGFSGGLPEEAARMIYGYNGGGGYGSYGGYGGGTSYYSGGYPGGYGSSGGSGYPAGGGYSGGGGYPAGGSSNGSVSGYAGGSSGTTTGSTTTGGSSTGGAASGGWISTLTPNNGIIPLPTGVTDTLTASDLGITFDGGGKQVLLSGEGNIRLTGTVNGKNGSITSGGELRITGLGADISASQNAEEGVNMYARGDIVFSSLDQAGDGTFGYDNVNLKGVVYTWGNFVCDQGSPSSDSRGKFSLEGVLVAYGGDPDSTGPAQGKPGSNGRGNILLSVAAADIVFNPAYLGGLSNELPANFGLKVISWNQLP